MKGNELAVGGVTGGSASGGVTETIPCVALAGLDALQLDVPAEWSIGARLELTDPCGRLVAVFNTSGGSGQRIELPVSLADGRYLLRLVSASRVLSAPVVVVR